MKFNAYHIVSRAVEEGVAAGYRRAHKRTDTPDEALLRGQTEDAVMDALSEVLDWDAEPEADPLPLRRSEAQEAISVWAVEPLTAGQAEAWTRAGGGAWVGPSLRAAKASWTTAFFDESPFPPGTPLPPFNREETYNLPGFENRYAEGSFGQQGLAGLRRMYEEMVAMGPPPAVPSPLYRWLRGRS